MGVSGGPDSMALCLLAAEWKTHGLNAALRQNKDVIDGLLAIIVDHGLRPESKEEAETVQHRILNMSTDFELFLPVKSKKLKTFYRTKDG